MLFARSNSCWAGVGKIATMTSEEASEPESEEAASPNKTRAALLERGRKRLRVTLPTQVDDEDETAASPQEQTLATAGSVWRSHTPMPEDSANVKLMSVRRYLRAARSLFEIQFQMKRPSAILKTKPNTYGFKTGSTADALTALLSPLRGHQVLDNWTALEIGIFEEAFDKFGKNFHLIAEQIQKKSVGDCIALYYVWKLHGSHAKTRLADGNCSPSDNYFDLSGPDVSNETLTLLDRLRKRQVCMQDYFDAVRALCPRRPSSLGSDRKRLKLDVFGLQYLRTIQPATTGSFPLRSATVLDSWTPLEIRVFEVAIECFGKEFHRIADAVRTKTSRDVVAFYYVWKKDSYYQVVKNRWAKRNETSKVVKKNA